MVTSYREDAGHSPFPDRAMFAVLHPISTLCEKSRCQMDATHAEEMFARPSRSSWLSVAAAALFHEEPVELFSVEQVRPDDLARASGTARHAVDEPAAAISHGGDCVKNDCMRL